MKTKQKASIFTKIEIILKIIRYQYFDTQEAIHIHLFFIKIVFFLRVRNLSKIFSEVVFLF